MKILAKVMEGAGFGMFLIGGSAMDSSSVILPIAIILCGIVVAWNGIALEDQIA